MLEVGSTAPEFSVSDHTGGTVSLSALAGSRVVLWFYPKADTPGWTIEGRGFRDLNKEFESKNVKVFGVSFDSVADNKAFAEKFDFPFPLLSDEKREMGIAYGACDTADAEYARRISYVIDDSGKIIQAHAKVDTKTHPREILASLWNIGSIPPF